MKQILYSIIRRSFFFNLKVAFSNENVNLTKFLVSSLGTILRGPLSSWDSASSFEKYKISEKPGCQGFLMLTIHLVSQWLLLKQIIVKGTKLVVQKCLILVQYQRFHYDEPQEMWVTDILDSFCSLSARWRSTSLQHTWCLCDSEDLLVTWQPNRIKRKWPLKNGCLWLF